MVISTVLPTVYIFVSTVILNVAVCIYIHCEWGVVRVKDGNVRDRHTKLLNVFQERFIEEPNLNKKVLYPLLLIRPSEGIRRKKLEA